MHTTLRAFLALALSCAAYAAGAEPARQPMVVHTLATYGCDIRSEGSCLFLLYTSDCKVAGMPNGHPALGCTHVLFAEFSLKPGESKTFDSLPPNVKQCQPRNGKLVFPDCAR